VHPRKIRRVLLAGGIGLLGTVGTVLSPSMAGAQAARSFTASPEEVPVGSSFTLTATGCLPEGEATQDAMSILINRDRRAFTEVPTDAEGTGTYASAPVTDDQVGTAMTFTAICAERDAEGGIVNRESYPLAVEVTVVAAAPTTTATTSAPPSTTSAPTPTTSTTAAVDVSTTLRPAPRDGAVAPRFTG
jgi:hypothetical protein